MAHDNGRRFYSFSRHPRFSNFSHTRFPRGTSRVHSLPEEGVGSGVVRGRDFLSSTKKGHRQSRRFLKPLFIPDFCNTQEVRGPACNFESQEDQLFSSSSTFQDGNVGSCVAPALQGGLGGDDRPSGCLSACPDSSPVQIPARVLSTRGMLPVSGSTVRSSRLPVGVLEIDSRRHCLSETERDQDFLLSRRLVAGGEVEGDVDIPTSDDLVCDASTGVSNKPREVFFLSNPTSFLPRSSAGHSQFVSSPDASQNFGTSDLNSGVFVDPRCHGRVVAEVTRSSSQLHGLNTSVPSFDASLAASLPEVLLPSDGSTLSSSGPSF